MKPLQIAFIAAGIAVLAGLFMFLKPQETAPAAAPADPAAPAPAGVAAQPQQELVAEYTVEKGQRTAGPELIRLRMGEKLTLSVLSDADDELHLHGYDLHLHVKAGQASRLSFAAEHSGRFDLELHKSNVQLGVLEVQPK